MNIRGVSAALALGASIYAMPAAAQEVAASPAPPKIQTVPPVAPAAPASAVVPVPVPPPAPGIKPSDVEPLPIRTAPTSEPLKLAPPADMAVDAGKFDVFLSPRMVIPPKEPVVRGTRRTVMPGEVLFKAPLGWLFHAKTDAPVAAEFSGIKVAVKPGEVLRRAVKFSGGDLARFDENTPVYCQRAKMNDAQNALSILTLGITDLATKVSKETQFCMLDTDNDGKFDHGFLEGFKLPEDRKTVAITPVAYKALTAIDDDSAEDGDYIQVRLAQNAGLFGRSILTEVFLDNSAQGITGVYWYMFPSMSRILTNASQSVPGKNYPQTMNFTTAVMKVHGYDKKTKALDIEYMADFRMTPLTLYFVSYY